MSDYVPRNLPPIPRIDLPDSDKGPMAFPLAPTGPVAVPSGIEAALGLAEPSPEPDAPAPPAEPAE
ncbi:MAG TPA: hypothetical protein VGK16_02035 [Candidatus Limnocylindrales bacterium]|jgi:hypothetical protein